MDHEALADRLKKMRKSRGWTLHKIGDAVGVSKNAVFKWENDHSVPNMKNLSALAKIFEVEPVFLAYGVIERKTPHDKLMKKISMLNDAEAALLIDVMNNMFGKRTDSEVIDNE